jgi:hypothetical protein
MLFCRFWILIFWLFARTSAAQEFIPPMPRDMASTKFSLLTVGLGTDLYTRYGHTMLRIEDSENNLDYLVNWGIFEFDDPMFIPKFFRGILIYKMGFSGTKSTLRLYDRVERRYVVQDDLNLTNLQKKKLMEKIIWNAQPENINYPYQYFRNNCSTKLRDYLDEVLGGVVSRQLIPAKTKVTYRDYVRSNLSNNFFVAWGLDIIFNGDNDHLLTQWDEAFYPIKLREYLASIKAVDDQGQPDPEKYLLSNNIVLVAKSDPEVFVIDGYKVAWVVSGVPLLVILISIMMRKRNGQIPLAVQWHYRVFGIVSLWWGLTCGFFGLTHFAGWAFSAHTDLHRNLNILLFWPFEAVVLMLALKWGVFGPGRKFAKSVRIDFWRKFAIFHIVIIPIYVIISMFGGFAQDTSRVVQYMVPLSLLYYLVLVRLCRESQSG